MIKRLFLITTRLATISILVVCFFSVPARASYFDDVYACDGNYWGSLYGCRDNPFYPYNPTEGDCRYGAGNSYLGCLNAIPTPSIEPDFCDNARALLDSCINQYSQECGNGDLSAYMDCRNASGIDHCQ
ncbi:MAG TPA: hypothetical protein VK582_06100 [Pyrinomonadaceae bacterium]|nr:hypothetical protein [Pyrinomonadaceae bacterium]